MRAVRIVAAVAAAVAGAAALQPTAAESLSTDERRKLWFVIGASSGGTIIEWYDFYIFGSLATIIPAPSRLSPMLNASTHAPPPCGLKRTAKTPGREVGTISSGSDWRRPLMRPSAVPVKRNWVGVPWW